MIHAKFKTWDTILMKKNHENEGNYIFKKIKTIGIFCTILRVNVIATIRTIILIQLTKVDGNCIIHQAYMIPPKWNIKQ